ncbi:helix-turn-helix domain-containing protein [Actinomadura litoris]|uniref:Helix-turn-helix domain-containing protein n=1 Tax=Actinomadura litoris TaxID=2678616 RepID=A0A7K1KYM1_9ACTN|nr:helix-turn-helix transcriptional regulator [Actinomadura litoris]MUN37143.1 helix-turn-helix domain-containing protein [Actinomadura litoris]
MPVDYRAPNINARRLGLHFRQIREALELSYDSASARLGHDADWLIRLETGFEQVTPEQAREILDGYGVPPHDMRTVVIDLASRPSGPPWLAPHAERLKALVRDLYTLESEATTVHTYGIPVIPELVRAEPYARLGFEYHIPEVDVEEEWDLLLQRQRHRPGGLPRTLDVIFCESALRNGPPEVMLAQCAHLLELSEDEHTSVRVIPFNAGAHAGLHGSFDVLEFPVIKDRISFVHGALGIDLAGSDLSDTWKLIEDVALPPAGSRDMISTVMHEYG